MLTILLTAAICSVIGYGYGRRRTWGSTPVADTVRIRDTVRDSIPYPVIETIVQEIPELFPNTKPKITVLGYLVISRHWIVYGFTPRRLSSGRNLADGVSV